jgi:hypothetical protein
MYELLRETEVDLKRYLPDFLFTDPSFMKVMEALNTYQEQQRQELIDVFKQFFISSATWGLTDWERVYGIAPESGSSYDIRRAALKIKKAGAATITNQLISWMINQYCPKGDARYIDNAGDGYAIVELNSASSVEAIRKTLDTYVPAHILFDIIAHPARQIALNRSGPLLTKVIPDTTWTEKQVHIVFDAGLNSSGSVATRTSSRTDTTTHRAIVFTGGRTNGSFTTNRSGGYTVNRKDVGYDVTDTWSVFSGDRLNSRASPHTNDSASATKSRTYHQPNWQDVVSWDGVNTNGSAHKTNTWSESRTTTKSERYFVRPLFALNCVGTTNSEYMDVGSDVEITETSFSGSTLNGSGASVHTDTSTRTVTTRSTVFTGCRLNGHGKLLTNEASSRTDTSSRTITAETVSRIFAGPRTNGTIRTNSGMPEHITHTVHIPKWRNVLHRTGGATTNYSKHSTKTIEIIHTIPGRTEKRFDPAIGTLTNDHAVMGYLRL